MADRYLELMRHQALIQPGAADALLDFIETTTQRQWPDDHGIARASECGQLRGTVRNLIAHIARLHDDLHSAAVLGACNEWIDSNSDRLSYYYGINIRAEHERIEREAEEADDAADYFGERRAA